ncbi:unnamed protein product [Triticum turgidum subsp. durum]|uniref:Proline dehydrogenase n=1 Tax=Triticum turgidum subsp. durum TaxID=4567 RepID=A0A9R0Q6W2_TRITD|nr:unnamed protein product [Triticum turgidum subsp. durum]
MAIASRITKRALSTFAAAAKLPEAAVAAAGADAVPAPSSAQQQQQVLEFEDTGRLFTGEPSTALVRTLAALQLMSAGPLVDVGLAALRSPAVAASPVVQAAARATAYKHFCAGETADEAAARVQRLWRGGMGGILDYGIEDAEDGAACDRNVAGFLAAVDVAAKLPPGSASVCIKITALCPIALLEKTSDLLRWQHKNPSVHLPWKQHAFPILSDSSPLYLTPSEPAALTAEEERELQLAHDRLLAVGARCAEHGIPLLVDAEYASVQPSIDYFTFVGALACNGGGRPIVHGTVQAYLRDARDRLEAMVRAAEEERVCLGVKIVRGAYLSLGLRNAGFQVSKYLPYGPVEHIIPYLIRRAEENRGLLSASAFDRQLLRKELVRRFKNAVMGRE